MCWHELNDQMVCAGMNDQASAAEAGDGKKTQPSLLQERSGEWCAVHWRGLSPFLHLGFGNKGVGGSAERKAILCSMGFCENEGSAHSSWVLRGKPRQCLALPCVNP